MSPNLSIDVEVFCGAGIDQACVELCALASKLRLVVKASFNGVTLMAMPGGDPSTLAINWASALKTGHQHKIATTHTPKPPAQE